MYFERPVLVLKKFSKELFIGIPLTTNVKQGKFYYPTNVEGKPGAAILSQIRVLDAKRLINRIGRMEEEDISSLKVKLAILLL